MRTTAAEHPWNEEFRDAEGNPRRFRLRQHHPAFLEAAEVLAGGAVGQRFSVSAEAAAPLGELRARIAKRLSERHVVRDADGHLHLAGDVLRGQITCAPGSPLDEEGLPILLVDDVELSWLEVGRLLMTYEGFGCRLEIREAGDE